MKKKLSFLNSILFALIAVSCSADETRQSEPDKIGLTPMGETMVLHANVPKFENQWFAVLLPKTVAEQKMSMVNFPSTTQVWKETESGGLKTAYNPGILVNYSIDLQPTADTIEATFTVTNKTDYDWEDVWFFTLLAPHGADEFKLENGGKVYLPTSEGIKESTSIDRTGAVHPYMMVLLNESRQEKPEPHFLKNLNCTVEAKATENWMIGMNANEDRWFAMAGPECVFMFTNDQISSLHVAPNFGNLKPLETATVHMTFRFGEGDLSSAISSIRADAKKLEMEESK